MHNRLFPFIAMLLSVLLCSCGFMTPPQQYAGAPKAMSEIAVIHSYHGSVLGDEYHATIAGYATRPEAGPGVVKRLGLTGFTDYPRELQLNPGNYALELYCFKSLAKPTFRPTFDITVQAGYAYTVKCEVAQGKASVVVSQQTRLL
jgi:hypothetical protein